MSTHSHTHTQGDHEFEGQQGRRIWRYESERGNDTTVLYFLSTFFLNLNYVTAAIVNLTDISLIVHVF